MQKCLIRGYPGFVQKTHPGCCYLTTRGAGGSCRLLLAAVCHGNQALWSWHTQARRQLLLLPGPWGPSIDKAEHHTNHQMKSI